MSKILLINPVIREFALPNNAPLGPLYIASYLEQHGHEVDICDLNALRTINPDREYWLEQYMKPYDFIGFSGLITTYKEQRRYMDYIMQHYADFGRPVIIAGGGLATSVPEFVFRHLPEFDVLVRGEGEITALDVVSGELYNRIPGLYYKTMDGMIHETPERDFIRDLDSIPFPAWDKVPINIYLDNPIWGKDAKNSSGINYDMKRSMNMVVSRGCPYSCSFCYHGVWGKQYRIRSTDNVIAEMKELKNRYDVDFIGFLDDNTVAIRSWSIEFCEKLIKEDLKIKWGCSARVNQVDPELLGLMSDAGCVWIGYGGESASRRILERMNKKHTPEQMGHAITWTRSAGIWANMTFICGYPGEREADIRLTGEFMKVYDLLGNMFFLNPYPGTQVYEQNKQKIIDTYGSEDAYIESLGDATEMRVNLSGMTTANLQRHRQTAMEGVL